MMAIAGPTGVGKTALAARHAAAHADELDIVWWARGSSRALVMADLRALAVAIGLEGTDTNSLVANAADWLATTEDRWLLVVDGVERWDDIADLLPSSGRGQLVVTGHQVPAEARDTAVLLRPFSPGEGADYLTAHRRHADASASSDQDPFDRLGDDEPQSVLERLSATLEGQPWALTLAARHLAVAEGARAEDLLAELADPPQVEGLHGGPGRGELDGPTVDALPSIDLQDEVPATDAMVLVAVNELALTSPTAAAAITAAAALAPAPLRRADLDQLSDSERTVTDLGHAHGLVETGADLVVMAGPVRDALRRRWTPAAAERSVGFTIELLDQQVSAHASASEADLYAPHVLEVLSGAAAHGLQTAGTARLAILGSDWLKRMGDLDAALGLARTGAQVAERELGTDDAVTHGARLALADLYVELGDHAAALEVQAQVVADHERTLGPDDPLTLHARANLAADHLLVGDYALAIVEGERAVTGLSAHYGPDHPETMAARDVLEASRSAEQAAAEQAAPQATDQAAAGTAWSNWAGGGLAHDRRAAATTAAEPDGPASGPWAEPAPAGAGPGLDAELDASVLTDLLAQQQASLGSAHPETLETLHRLGTVHSESGAYPAAIDSYERLVEGSIEAYGADDLRTLTARNDLANAYATAGQHDRALQMLEAVVEGAVRAHGSSSPGTLTAKHNLANSYADLGRQEEALELRQEVLQERESLLGPDHPQTVGARNNLANSLAELDRREEALVLREQVVATRRATLGDDHPQTLGAMNNLANSYADLGQHEEALELREEVLTTRDRVLGPDHPHTLTARNNLANSYAALGRAEEALRLRQRAVADCERVLGPDHPHTLTARNNLASSWPQPVRWPAGAGSGGLVTASASATTTAPLPEFGPGWPAGPEPEANGAAEANGHRESGPKRRRFWFFWRR
jgi:tetratricopeptide (TPR) repeat protein